MTTTCHADSFVPADLDATRWENLEPLYQALLDRPIRCPSCLERILLDRSELDATVSEAEADLYIEMTCHTDDEAAQAAYLAFVENVEPKLRQASFDLDRRIVECPFAAELDQDRYGVLLRDLKTDVELFRPENIPLQTEITKLDQEYSQVNGAMTVHFRGEEETMARMGRFLEETDRATREAAWRAVQERRAADRDRINGIFDKLVARRHQTAINAGFANFRDFQHKRMRRFDYTPEDCQRYHEGIEQVVVPLLRRLNAERATELGVDPLRPWDLAVDVKGRQPLRPFKAADELVDKTSRVFHRMRSDLGQMFDAMRGGGCLDLESRKGKAPGGYQYQRQRSRRPFIFMNAAGLHRDLVTMVHEAGHAFHSTFSKDDPILHYRNSPMEFAEVASMSMELLAFPFLDEFYSAAEADRARRHHLEDLATKLAWIAQIDAFQHWIYTHPTHTPAERGEQWVALTQRFGPAVSWAGIEDFLPDQWHRQLHLFGVPFYYIEYGIAQLGALQLWLQARQDLSSALDNYARAMTLGGSRPLPELFEAAGLRFDFGADTMRTLMSEVGEELERLPA
ncbi:MAG: M3 family oligoendopeptidase [Phycisphaerales bacterium]|nr:M3 family oligoendopeptidase [Phycisphaerales bacterium]